MPIVRRARPALLLIAAVLLAAGCGDEGEDTSTEPVQGVGVLKAGSAAALAQCKDWNEGTEDERMATIADIRGRASEQARLTDAEAYALFESACSRGYTAGFRLYKIYDRAAAFNTITPE